MPPSQEGLPRPPCLSDPPPPSAGAQSCLSMPAGLSPPCREGWASQWLPTLRAPLMGGTQDGVGLAFVRENLCPAQCCSSWLRISTI